MKAIVTGVAVVAILTQTSGAAIAATPPASFVLPSISGNLASGAKSIRATNALMAGAGPVTIVVGNRMQVVTPGAMLTPAEAFVVREILQTGTQTLQLSSRGIADGGTLYTNQWEAYSVLNFDVPKNVTAVGVLNGSPANFIGSVVNYGTIDLYGYTSTQSGVATGPPILITGSLINRGTIYTVGIVPAVILGKFANTGTITNYAPSGGSATIEFSVGGGFSNGSPGITSPAHIVSQGTIAISTPGNIVNFANGVISAPQIVNVNDSPVVGAGIFGSDPSYYPVSYKNADDDSDVIVDTGDDCDTSFEAECVAADACKQL